MSISLSSVSSHRALRTRPGAEPVTNSLTSPILYRRQGIFESFILVTLVQVKQTPRGSSGLGTHYETQQLARQQV
jgi:hypothetical protein